MRSVVLFSGGMDSTVLLATRLAGGDEVTPLFFLYGQQHQEREAQASYALSRHYGVERFAVVLPDIRGGSLMGDGTVLLGIPTVVPVHNPIFLMYAANVAVQVGAEAIFFAAHQGDHAIYPDCRPEFVAAANRVLETAGVRVRIEAPFAAMGKRDLVALGQTLAVPWNLTWSCYAGGETPCGKCGACVERYTAFSEQCCSS